MKTYPKVGDKLYLRQFTGDSFVDQVKEAYTVIKVDKSKVVVQSCKYVWPTFHYEEGMSDYYREFDGQECRFYDTLPEKILEDNEGVTKELTWHSKRQKWGTKGRESDYPEFAIFGEWRYQPYLN